MSTYDIEARVMTGRARDARASEIVARLDRLPISSWHTRAAVVLGAALFWDGFDLLTISYTLPVLAGIWRVGPEQIGLILSFASVGQLVGSLGSGWLAERFGRLRVITFLVALFGIMSLVCTFAWNWKSMVVFRFFQGIGLGGEVPVAASYIVEISRARDRGRFYTLYGTVFSLATVCAAGLGYWIVPRFGWRMLFYIGATPIIVSLLVESILQESPRWLVNHDRVNEADTIVQRLEQAIVKAGGILPQPVVAEGSSWAPRVRWTEMFEGIYLRRTSVVWVLWFSSHVAIYGLVTWIPTIYRTVFHLSLSKSLGYGLVTQSAVFVSSLSAAFLIDIVGRRRWFVVAFLTGGASLSAIWLFGASSASRVLIYSSIGVAFLVTISVILHLYTAELYPTRIRALGCGIGSGWQRLAAILGPALVGFVLATHGMRFVFAVFSIFALIGALTSLVGGTETRTNCLEKLSP
jgi:putative MFS transporter